MSEWFECDKPERAPEISVCSVCGAKDFKWIYCPAANQYRVECRSCGHRSEALSHSRNQRKITKRTDQRDWAEAVIRHANGICQICHEAPAEEAHHFIPVAVGEQMGLSEYCIWSLFNGIACCPDCHRKFHDASFDIERKVHSIGENIKRQRGQG